MAEKKKIDKKSFTVRLISGIVLVLLALLTVPRGGAVLLAVVAVISLIGISELYHVFGIHNKLLGLVGYAGAAAYYLFLFLDKENLVLPLLVGVFILCMAVYVFSFPKFGTEQVMGGIFRTVLCRDFIILSLSHQRNERWHLPGMADFFKFLGM